MPLYTQPSRVIHYVVSSIYPSQEESGHGKIIQAFVCYVLPAGVGENKRKGQEEDCVLESSRNYMLRKPKIVP